MISERNKGRLFAIRAGMIGLLHELDTVMQDEVNECSHRRIREPETFNEDRKCLDCGEVLEDSREQIKTFSKEE